MTSRRRLTDAQVAAALTLLPGWRQEGEALVKTFQCADFLSAVALVQRVAPLAEAMDHHPDLRIHGYDKVTFYLSTHDMGGISTWDVDLAQAIDGAAG